MDISVCIPFRVIPAYLGFAVLTVLSVGSADAATMTLRWDPNPESTIAGYIVSMGTSAGQYARATDVGNQTSFQFEAPTPPAIYYFVVRAYDSAGNQSLPSAEVSTGPWPAPLTLSNISASLTPPQVIGTTVTFQALATGGVAPYRYKWLIFDGTTWSLATDWLTDNTFTWRPLTENPNYRVGVWVRSATSSGDAPDNPGAAASIPFAITGANATFPTIDASKIAPQPPHTSIKFTANVAGSASYRYKWWVFDGVSWHIDKEWSSSNTFTWTPRTPNEAYRVLVRVQSVADPADSAGVSMVFPIIGD